MKKSLWNKFIENWYSISVYIAGALALILCLGSFGIREKMLLTSSIFIFMHFFEEFGFPGGFPWIGMRIELGIKNSDTSKWPLNQVNAMFGNFCFAVLVYLLPLFLPEVKFLTSAAAVFAFAEVLMHLIFFNIKLKTLYNPGLLTAVFGLLPVSVWYLNQTLGRGIFGWLDWVLAFAWIAFNYWLAFRSPIYKKLGNLSDKYGFATEDIKKSETYMKKIK